METEIIHAYPTNSIRLETDARVFESHTYSVGETAQVLGVSYVTVYRLIARRLLRPLPHMRHKRIPKRQVHDFIAGVEVSELSNAVRSVRRPASMS